MAWGCTNILRSAKTWVWKQSWLYGQVRSLLRYLHLQVQMVNSNVGYSLAPSSVNESQLGPYIQQAVDQASHLQEQSILINLLTQFLDQFCYRRFCLKRTGYVKTPSLVNGLDLDLYIYSATIRASMGHPEPFKLAYVEVGNEVSGFRLPLTVPYLVQYRTLFPQGRYMPYSSLLAPKKPISC